MVDINDLLKYSTIAELSSQDKNDYFANHIQIVELLQRINSLELKVQSIGDLEQKIDILTRNYQKCQNTIKNLEKKVKMYEENTVEKSNDDEVIGLSQIKSYTSENPKKKGWFSKILKLEYNVSDELTIGNYEGKPIKWIVIDKNEDDNSVLIISKHVLFKDQYHNVKEVCSWKDCSLRRYLNTTFFETSFSNLEKMNIRNTITTDNKSNDYFPSKGTEVVDKLFLLSSQEMERYFSNPKVAVGTYENGEVSRYWLRTTGLTSNRSTMFVNSDGIINKNGTGSKNHSGVRPALWINNEVL